MPVDVSITQLCEARGSWETHDIVAGKKRIDVKNARRSRPGGRSYARHTAKFKKDRDMDEHVVLTGVLSDALTVEDYRLGRRGQACWLGEVELHGIRALVDYLASAFSDVLDLRFLNQARLARPTLVPGWMFEYPPEQYCKRAAVLADIKKLFSEARSKPYRLSHYLAAFVDDESLVSEYLPETADRRIWIELRRLKNGIGITRSSLYYVLLGISLKEAKQGCRDFHPDLLTKWLFHDGKWERPLGLLDPQEYVRELVLVLSDIWERGAHQELSRFKNFRLAAPGIIRGVLENGREWTVLAYCGGCGLSPLYIGKSEFCRICGRLICPDCGYCSESCNKTPRPDAG